MAKAFDSHIGSGTDTSVIMPYDIWKGRVAQKGALSRFCASSFLMFWQMDITPHKCHVSSPNCSWEFK